MDGQGEEPVLHDNQKAVFTNYGASLNKWECAERNKWFGSLQILWLIVHWGVKPKKIGLSTDLISSIGLNKVISKLMLEWSINHNHYYKVCSEHFTYLVAVSIIIYKKRTRMKTVPKSSRDTARLCILPT